MSTNQVLQYLKKHGQKLDREIAEDTGIPLTQIRFSLAELSALKEISNCSVIHYKDGKPIEGMLCRVSGYIPPAAPGRKAAAK
jgi:predicted ArsR family transcriptional regulator